MGGFHSNIYNIWYLCFDKMKNGEFRRCQNPNCKRCVRPRKLKNYKGIFLCPSCYGHKMNQVYNWVIITSKPKNNYI